MTTISPTTETTHQARITARIIYRIAARFVRMSETAGTPCPSADSIFLDVLGTHECACPLDLEGLLTAGDIHFAHDLSGIIRHYNRNTRKLDDHFQPRYFKQTESASVQEPPFNTERLRREAHAANPLLCDSDCGCQPKP